MCSARLSSADTASVSEETSTATERSREPITKLFPLAMGTRCSKVSASSVVAQRSSIGTSSPEATPEVLWGSWLRVVMPTASRRG